MDKSLAQLALDIRQAYDSRAVQMVGGSTVASFTDRRLNTDISKYISNAVQRHFEEHSISSGVGLREVAAVDL